MTIEALEEDIKTQVESHIRWDDRLSKANIRVEVNGSAVTLQGNVPSYALIRVAEMGAFSVEGVRSVNNLLTVELPPEIEMPTDEEMEAGVMSMFQWDSRLEPEHITVVVANGTVVLSGKVHRYWKKVLAGDIARSVTGVRQVVNNLMVPKGEKWTDNAIAEAVKSAIQRNPLISSEDILVKVENGKAILKGAVSSRTAVWAAHDAALYTAGVTGIEDHLQVV